MQKFFNVCGYVGILGVAFFLLPTSWLTLLGCTGAVLPIGIFCAVFLLGIPATFKPTNAPSEPSTH